MIGIANMTSPTTQIMDSPRRKKKTRRGKKKKSWRDMIPPPEEISRPEKEKSSADSPCRCGTSDIRSPTKSAQGRVPTPRKNAKGKPYLRPFAPRAPPNSTQFIMDCHIDQDFSLYGSENCSCQASPCRCECGSISPHSRQISPATVSNTHCELKSDGELDMVSFVLNDFESVMNEFESDSKFNRERLDDKIVFSRQECDTSSMVSSPAGSSCSESSSRLSSSPESLYGASPTVSPNQQFRSWSNTSMLLDVSQTTDQNHNDTPDSSDISSSTESFLKFMSNDFESELQKSKEESLYDKSSDDLISDILEMQKRANVLSRIEILQSLLEEVKSQNQALKSENERLKNL